MTTARDILILTREDLATGDDATSQLIDTYTQAWELINKANKLTPQVDPAMANRLVFSNKQILTQLVNTIHTIDKML